MELRWLSLPGSLESVPAGLLRGIPSIGAVDLSACSLVGALPPHSLGTDNGSLSVVKLPEGLHTIEAGAFLSEDGTPNARLDALTIPSSLTTLEPGALVGAGNMTSLDLSGTSIQVL